MKRIKFGEVRLGPVAKANIQKCIDNNWLTMGPMVAEFEEKCAAKMGYQYVVAVSNGTMADTLAYLSLNRDGSKRGKKVIVPALSFIATATSLVAAGFLPVPIDVKKDSLNIDETLIEDKIDKDVVAIVIVNTMGKPCRVNIIKSICDKYNLPLIIDNCEGHLCRYNNKGMNEWSDISTYSGYAAHIISASNEFGWIGTNNKETAEYIQSIRSHGRANNSLYFNHINYGLNGKANDLAASVALESLSNIDEIILKRRYNLLYMISQLEELRDIFYINKEELGEYHCPHALSLTFINDNGERFKKFYNYLDNNGIEVKLNFKCSFTQHTALDFLGHKLGEYPNAEHIGRNGLHVGCHQFMEQFELDHIINTIKKFLRTY